MSCPRPPFDRVPDLCDGVRTLLKRIDMTSQASVEASLCRLRTLAYFTIEHPDMANAMITPASCDTKHEAVERRGRLVADIEAKRLLDPETWRDFYADRLAVRHIPARDDAASLVTLHAVANDVLSVKGSGDLASRMKLVISRIEDVFDVSSFQFSLRFCFPNDAGETTTKTQVQALRINSRWTSNFDGFPAAFWRLDEELVQASAAAIASHFAAPKPVLAQAAREPAKQQVWKPKRGVTLEKRNELVAMNWMPVSHKDRKKLERALQITGARSTRGRELGKKDLKWCRKTREDLCPPALWATIERKLK